MNIINVEIDFTKGTNKLTGINLITGDYASTKMIFQFDREDGTKVLEIKNPSGNVVFLNEIVNNEVILAAVENGLNYSIFETEGRYIYEVSLYNGDSKLTSVKGEIPVAKEQVVINGEVIEPYLPLFDELMQQINTAITETNNLNISGTKVNTTTTITITNKDGTTQTLQVLDGEQGPQGERGPAGVIRIIICPNGLPETGEEGPLYEVPKEEPTTQDLYDEYMWVDNKWELMGEKKIAIDLTDYVKNTDYATSSKGGVIKAGSAYNAYSLTSEGYLQANIRTYAQYQTDGNKTFIGKGTLENVITGKELVSKSDYAGNNNNVAGVIKVYNTYGVTIDNTGSLKASTFTNAQYGNATDFAFISKGTLNNVLTAQIGNIQTLLDNLDSGNGV